MKFTYNQASLSHTVDLICHAGAVVTMSFICTAMLCVNRTTSMLYSLSLSHMYYT